MGQTRLTSLVMNKLGDRTRIRAAKPHAGRLIVLEGPNDVGKTTISEALAQWLNEQGFPSEVHAFPGRAPGSLGHHVYRLHHAPLELGVEEFSPAALQALHVAAHLDAIERTILPKLASGIDVVLDRYWWSTMAYGIATGVSESVLRSLIAAELLAWNGQVPTLVVVLERAVPVTQDDQTDFIRSVREQYLRIAQAAAREHPSQVIANDGTVDQTVSKIVSLLES